METVRDRINRRHEERLERCSTRGFGPLDKRIMWVEQWVGAVVDILEENEGIETKNAEIAMARAEGIERENEGLKR